MEVRTIILRTAGTNCDMETAHAFRAAGAKIELVHVNTLLRKERSLSRYHILAIPGGFTYGDDIASGKVLANELRFKLGKELMKFIRAGKLIIGICNGFQVLVKMGLLPNTNPKPQTPNPEIEATLSLNDSGKFEDRWVYLKKTLHASRFTLHDKCIWTRNLPEVIYLPVAHGEGKFIPRDSAVLESLKQNGQIVFRYTDSVGRRAAYPANPNGSVDDIAGICDPTGRILGMMPHPERHASYLQHPNWRRFDASELGELGVGLGIFKNGVKFARHSL